MDFDVILRDVGEFGRYQILLLIFVIIPACVPGGMHSFSQLFLVATPKHSCHIPINSTQFNSSLFIPRGAKPSDIDAQCLMYDLDYTNDTMLTSFTPTYDTPISPCRYGWDYDRSMYRSTVVTQWNLVCSHKLLPTFSLTVHTFGSLTGSLLLGYVGDRFGRKPAYYIAVTLQLLSGVGTVFAPNFVVFCIIRFINGLTTIPVWIFPLIMALELIGPNKRAPVGTTMSLINTLAVLGLGGIAYAIRDWMSLQLTVTLSFSFLIFWWWLLPESPRWLMAEGRFEDMLKIVKKIARLNRVELTEEQIETWRDTYFKSTGKVDLTAARYSPLDLFRTPNLRMKTILMVFNSFSNNLVYNGLNFFVPQLGDNEHVSFLLSSVVEVPSYFILYFTLDRFGRKVTIMSTMLIGGIFSLLAAATATLPTTMMVLVLAAKFCINLSFFIVDLMVSELIPTVVRGEGATLTQTVSAIGLCISPAIMYWGNQNEMGPLILFGVLALAGAGAILRLPETANTKLPDTLEEGEEFGKHARWINVIPRCCRKSCDGDTETESGSDSGPEKAILLSKLP
ncbi:beta-alanine transporter-like [Paramacrobiotus metropolitanus]|uniref:beta-alanine transporter-like n=1 Tax=Paramacrobiotus metropolitanus TaxID=2943436 RepID=UPI002445F25F|nr:beta-alanine transporter-like [Paramacrobiotus metropolitanus]